VAEAATGTLRVAVTLEQCWHRVPGGVARSALASVRALQRGHAELDLVGVAARHRSMPPAPWIPTIPVRRLALPRPALYEAWHRFRRPPVEVATGPVDVIHATGMAVPPRSAPVVVTVHDLAFLRSPEMFTRRGVDFFRRSIELATAEADLVVCPSQLVVDDCVAHGFDADRMRLVPWGVDAVVASEPQVAAVRRRLGLDRPYVLWLGTVQPRKNVETLLRAFALVDTDAVLVLAGPTGWNTDLAPLVDRLGPRARSIGFVNEDDKAALYAGAELFCLPSREEGFGLPLLEAMAQGTPVVTSRATSMAEIVGDDPEAGLLVDTDDDAALAAALQQVLDDDHLRKALGAGARRRAATLTWSVTADRLAAVYREAASR
jgi:glycosyltransferase involved in cell wall biosynthesis